MTVGMAGIAALVAMCVTWIAAPLLIPHAARWRLVDHPGGRKTHARSTPLVGSLAMAAGIAAAVLLVGGLTRGGLPAAESAFAWPISAAILAGAVILLVVGIIDDQRELGAAAKLVAQVAAALPLAVVHDVSIFHAWLPVWPASAVELLWILAVVNAFNMLDGIDGLMGSVALLCTLAIAVLAWSWQLHDAFFLLAALAGALLGFLRWNLPPARTFAGDGGSLMVGYLVAALSIRVTGQDAVLGQTGQPYAIVALLLILAIPFYDLVSVVWLRTIERRWLFGGDTSHLAHRLVRRGLSPRRTLVFIVGCTLLTAIAGLLLARVGRPAAPSVISQCLVVMGLLALMEAKTRPAP